MIEPEVRLAKMTIRTARTLLLPSLVNLIDRDDNEEARDFHRRFDRHAYEGHREILGENSRLKRRVTRLEAYSTQFCTKAAFAIYVRLIQLR